MNDILKQLEKDFDQIRSDVEKVRPNLKEVAKDILNQIKESFKFREGLVTYSESAVETYPFLANRNWVDYYLNTFKIKVDDMNNVTLYIDPLALKKEGFPEDFPTQIETGNPLTELPSIIHLREEYDV